MYVLCERPSAEADGSLLHRGITITALTDVLEFPIGVPSDFPLV